MTENLSCDLVRDIENYLDSLKTKQAKELIDRIWDETCEKEDSDD